MGDEGQGEKSNFLGIPNRIKIKMKRKRGEGDWGRWGEVFKIAAKLIWGVKKVGENKKEIGQLPHFKK